MSIAPIIGSVTGPLWNRRCLNDAGVEVDDKEEAREEFAQGFASEVVIEVYVGEGRVSAVAALDSLYDVGGQNKPVRVQNIGQPREGILFLLAGLSFLHFDD